uniref:DNAJ-containing protein X-domain domain-containing protein n=1 Tax=Helicotheca tamesis TaxID=374047 RepID=A0A7S2H5Q8_9STRA|mmetsp:Transcript_1547/g.2207  ORF Transcript_1547/g.2207 Transcript_1547/m.2207 type:complete len:365 (+) Transcript_1547:1175-2269(+)
MSFFAVMFGSTLVEPYVGELWIATTADSVMKDAVKQQEMMSDEEDLEKMQEEAADLAGRAVAAEEAKLKQRKREVKIAMNLRTRIAEYMDGSMTEEDFRADCQNEAEKIAKGSFGSTFLVTIGNALLLESDEYLGFQKSFLGVDGHLTRARKRAGSIQANYKIVSSGIKAASAGRKVYKEVESAQQKLTKEHEKEAVKAAADAVEGTSTEDDADATAKEQKHSEEAEAAQAALAAAKLEESIPAILELAWAVNVRDISRTLRKVCKKLFSDASVTLEDRQKRAYALRVMGKEFFTTGKAAGGTTSVKADSGDIKARAEVAVMTTMAKAQGQEVSEEDTESLIQQAKTAAAEAQKSAEGAAGKES